MHPKLPVDKDQLQDIIKRQGNERGKCRSPDTKSSYEEVVIQYIQNRQDRHRYQIEVVMLFRKSDNLRIDTRQQLN